MRKVKELVQQKVEPGRLFLGYSGESSREQLKPSQGKVKKDPEEGCDPGNPTLTSLGSQPEGRKPRNPSL